jgi:hypothetical protein
MAIADIDTKRLLNTIAEQTKAMIKILGNSLQSL